MLDGRLRLMSEWENDCMANEGCCCGGGGGGGGEAGSHRENTLIELLQKKATRQHRMAQCLAVALIVVIAGTLALLFLAVLGGRGPAVPDSQTVTQPNSHSSGASFEKLQQKNFQNPSAMLTAPTGKNVNEGYLQWESVTGNAFCHGGFNYSSGSLVVPRKGIYRVFLQITYESSNKICSPTDDELRLNNSVFFFHDSYRKNRLLLSSVDSVSCSQEEWSKSLYTAGVFFLEEDSRLRVTSSHPDLIVKHEDQVFFGAEYLPQ